MGLYGDSPLLWLDLFPSWTVVRGQHKGDVVKEAKVEAWEQLCMLFLYAVLNV